VQINVKTGAEPAYPAMSTFIDVSVLGNPGQVLLDVGVTVTDRFATTDDNVATTYAYPILETQKLVWEPRYRQVVNQCWNRYITTHN